VTVAPCTAGVEIVQLRGGRLAASRARLQAIGSWGWDYVAKTRASAYINRPDATRIDWDE
jgi:hypothetical protein